MSHKLFGLPIQKVLMYMATVVVMVFGLVPPILPAKAQVDYASCFWLENDFQLAIEDGTLPTQRIVEFWSLDLPGCWLGVAALEMTIVTRDNTAIAGTDYEPLMLNLHLTPSDFVEGVYNIPVTILPDMVVERYESFWVEASNFLLIMEDGTQLPLSLPNYQTIASIPILDYRPSGPFIMTNPVPYSSPHDLVTSEDGTTATIEIWLAVEPTIPVTIDAWTCVGINLPCFPAEAIVSPQSLVFTPDNYYIPQYLTVIGLDDSLVEPGPIGSYYWVFMQASYPNSLYDGWGVTLFGENLDNDSSPSVETPPTETPPTELPPPIIPPGNPSVAAPPVDISNPALQPYLVEGGLFRIEMDTSLIAYDAPQGQPVSSNGHMLLLPNDSDHNGYDTYVIYGVIQLEDETWVALRLSDETFVWVVLP